MSTPVLPMGNWFWLSMDTGTCLGCLSGAAWVHVLPLEGWIQNLGCCFSLVWEESKHDFWQLYEVRVLVPWRPQNVVSMVLAIHRCCSGGMQGQGPLAGQLGEKVELCEAIGINENVLGENTAIHPGWTNMAPQWLVALVQAAPAEVCSLESTTCALHLLLLPMLPSRLLDTTTQASNMCSCV